MAADVEDDPMLSSLRLTKPKLFVAELPIGTHPGLHSVKRNATAVTLRSGQIIEYTH